LEGNAIEFDLSILGYDEKLTKAIEAFSDFQLCDVWHVGST